MKVGIKIPRSIKEDKEMNIFTMAPIIGSKLLIKSLRIFGKLSEYLTKIL